MIGYAFHTTWLRMQPKRKLIRTKNESKETKIKKKVETAEVTVIKLQ